MPNKYVDLLRAAKAKIIDKKNWTQGYYARDSQGVPALPDSPHATCWCASGALNAVISCFEELDTTTTFLQSAARSERGQKIFYGLTSIIRINDYLEHAAVMQLFDLAIELAEKEPTG